MKLYDDLRARVKGDVADDAETIKKYSRDTSIFERVPKVVVFPKDAADVSAVVQYVHDAKARGEAISLAPRSAGTDMTGGPLTDSISMVFTKYMNHIGPISDDSATTEPGAYYRDFEKETLEKAGKLLPSYPASRQLCAMGGIISNNSGGELTLHYGKTNRYVRELDVVLSDGSEATFHPLTLYEAQMKARQQDFEGTVYRETLKLLNENADAIEAARPTVTKNSAGYALWDVIDRQKQTFDLTQLITGSQGTLAIVTRAKLGIVKPKAHRAMLVIFLADIGVIPEIVRRVLAHQPESFESYDKHTFRLAVRFLPQFLQQMGLIPMIKLGLAFIPELWMTVTGGIPELVLMVEFAEDSHEEALEKVRQTSLELKGLAVQTTIARSEAYAAKYWTIRRESFALLRKNIKGMYAAPFIDDFVVHPDDYPQFLPALHTILDQYHFIYTIAGHIGDGNFHIFPLMDMSDPKTREAILNLSPKVYELVAKYKGSITGEHNDGIIRTPYLEMMYGKKIVDLFAQVKKIFDPLNILNPGKKVGGTIEDIKKYMITRV